jgi:hypothetical protein
VLRAFLPALLAALLAPGAAPAGEAPAPPPAYLDALPSAPVLMARVRPDEALRRLLREGRAAGHPLAASHRRLRAAAAEDARAALTLLLWRLAALPPESGLRRGGMLCFIRPRELFTVVPHGVLLVPLPAGRRPDAALALLGEGLRFARPDGPNADGGAEAAPLLFAGRRGDLLVLAENEATLREVLQAPAGGLPPEERKRLAPAGEAPLRVWLDGALLGLLPFIANVYVPEGWSAELQAVDAVHLGFTPAAAAAAHQLELAIRPVPDSRGLLHVLQGAELSLAAAGGGPVSARLRAALSLDWPASHTRLWQWLERRWPEATEEAATEFEELSLMAGIHIPRDILNALDGRLRLEAAADRRPALALACGVAAPDRLRRALARGAVWGTHFARRDLADAHLLPGNDAAWQAVGLPAAFPDRLRLAPDTEREGAARAAGWLLLGPRLPETPASTPSTGPRPALRLRAAADRRGLDVRLEVAPEAEVPALARQGGRLLRLIGGTESEPPVALATLGLRAIVMAECMYRTLELGRFNGLPARSYQPQWRRLMTDVDRHGEPLLALPEVLVAERHPYGSPWTGLRFRTLERIDARPVDWRRECSFAAVSQGRDGAPAGVYIIREDGVVYFRGDLAAPPESFPADPLAAGWTSVTHRWDRAGPSPAGPQRPDLD